MNEANFPLLTEIFGKAIKDIFLNKRDISTSDIPMLNSVIACEVMKFITEKIKEQGDAIKCHYKKCFLPFGGGYHGICHLPLFIETDDHGLIVKIELEEHYPDVLIRNDYGAILSILDCDSIEILGLILEFNFLYDKKVNDYFRSLDVNEKKRLVETYNSNIHVKRPLKLGKFEGMYVLQHTGIDNGAAEKEEMKKWAFCL